MPSLHLRRFRLFMMSRYLVRSCVQRSGSSEPPVCTTLRDDTSKEGLVPLFRCSQPTNQSQDAYNRLGAHHTTMSIN